MIKARLTSWALLILVAILWSPATAQIDPFAPDSAYLKQPYYLPEDCGRKVKCVVPLYLFADEGYFMAEFQFSWTGPARYDTILVQGQWSEPTAGFGVFIDSLNYTGEFSIAGNLVGFLPHAEIVAEIIFHLQLDDTLSLTIPYEEFWLFQPLGFNTWHPAQEDIDTTIVAPDTMAMAPGDADCSGSVDISDGVYLISYIFGGGSPPYDLNSADVDQSCIVDISDAVYLITYIFGGGPSPMPGCVY